MGQKVLILGGSYFIGKTIAEAFVENGYSVYTLNRGTKPPDGIWIKNIVCDRNDNIAMKEALKGHSFEIVVDVSGLNREQAEALLFSLSLDTVKKFFYISSSAVYDVHSLKPPFREKDHLGSNRYWGGYGVCKAQAEQAYMKAFEASQTNLVILRPPYVYGEYNYACRESFVFDHILGERPIIIPEGNSTIQFIYAGDLAGIIHHLAKLPLGKLSLFNVGNRKGVTFREWIDCCFKASGKETKTLLFDYAGSGFEPKDFFPFHDYDNVLDVTKINKYYTIETPFEKGLSNAYAWYLANQGKVPMKPELAENEERILKLLGL